MLCSTQILVSHTEFAKKVKMLRKVAIARDLGTIQIQNCKSMGNVFAKEQELPEMSKIVLKKHEKKKTVLKRQKSKKMEGSQ